MRCRLSLNRAALQHPVAKGDASEAEWIDLLAAYLPTRYNVARTFVIDHRGQVSEQIDIVIFDRHFSPFLFRQNGQSYVPAESVYATFEVRQRLNGGNIEYAAGKVESVRRLTRTSARIVDRGVPRPPRSLPSIIGGIVCLCGKVTPAVETRLLSLEKNRRLDLGCSLKGNSFFVDYDKKCVTRSSQEDSLVFFFLKLLARLQIAGTVPPMEIDKYTRGVVRKIS